jgi:hypothetical protein
VQPFPGARLDEAALRFNKIDPFHPFRIAVSEAHALNDIFERVRKEVQAVADQTVDRQRKGQHRQGATCVVGGQGGAQGGQIEVKFASKRGGEGVRVAVYERGAREPLAATKYELDGEFRTPLARQHEYRVEVENLRQRLGHALVDLEVTLVFGARAEAAPPDAARPLDPARRRYTIATSLALFGLILAYSAIKLTPPVLERWRGER